MVSLKFTDVQQRAGLDPSTAQYVLKSGELPGMPEAGRQGVHRRFDLEQALRLAICTHLVMHGVPLTKAVLAVEYCEIQVQVKNPKRFKQPLSFELPTFSASHWELVMHGGRFLTAKIEDITQEETGGHCLDLETEKTRSDSNLPQTHGSFSLDLTTLEKSLASTKD